MQNSKNTCVSASDSPYCCSVDEAKAVVGEVSMCQHQTSTSFLLDYYFITDVSLYFQTCPCGKDEDIPSSGSFSKIYLLIMSRLLDFW